ncbi:hypothetical protein GQ54DRAFT_311627 [Martensiomyces pterosporus]|nr:hypothetical protein GQ54DRAFT_311627 [Martensiomyces pterosporus]
MYPSPAATLKRRLASIHDTAHKQTFQHQQPTPSRGTPSSTFTTQAKTTKPGNASASATGTNSEKPNYITEESFSYLFGGPFNRFALALKSNLENEIDWACIRLVPATHQAPESWSLVQHAPFLVESILGVLEQSRRELTRCTSSGGSSRSGAEGTCKAIAHNVKATILGGSGHEMVVERASERAGLLATALFNIAQIGDNALVMGQDPRITIEATQWLRAFHSDSSGHTDVKANLLDLLDIILPLTPQPPFDSPPIRVWPVLGSRESAMLDPLALVETCLWEELVYLLCESRERPLVLGALRLLVQSVSWHPQLAREILDLPVPKRHVNATQECVGELVNARLSELLLAPDVEIVSACFELLLNTVRLESMANALDEELEAFAVKSANISSSVAAGAWKRRKRLRGGFEVSEPPSGGDSGAQTPIFGFRPLSRTSSSMGADAVSESEPSMLPDGLTALVALVSQQWLSAACPPQQLPAPAPPHKQSTSVGNKDGATNNSGHQSHASGPSTPSHPSSAASQQQQQQQQAANRPPTEPELREACTWALLNYEFVPPNQAPQQPNPPLVVRLIDVFRRYMIAKHGQTVPRIGRALNLTEMVRVIAAVFPNAPMRSTSGQPQQRGQALAAESLIATNLRPKSQHIIPIPAVTVDANSSAANAQQQQKSQEDGTDGRAKKEEPNSCLWQGCDAKFESEEAALAHVSDHVKGADACRWKSCNRIPGNGVSDTKAVEHWISRHVLVHGPFYKEAEAGPADSGSAKEAADDKGSTKDGGAVASPDLFLLAQKMRDEKSQLLNLISPLFSGESPQSDQAAQQQVLRLVLQGIGVVEQLQRWADRRVGRRGEQDRVRVWRSGDDVLERVAFVAAQNTPVAQYASRLLAVISKPNVL